MNELENYENEQEPNAKPDETKAERFERLALFRYTKAVERIRMLAPLANRNNYEFDANDVRAMLQVLHDEVDKLSEEFFKPKTDDDIVNPFGLYRGDTQDEV